MTQAAIPAHRQKRDPKRSAMLVVGLIVAINIGGLFLNALLSWRIEQQVAGINLAGRQRMLSQRMVKVLLQIDAARGRGEPLEAYMQELKVSFDIFDNTLRGFDVGHETLDAVDSKRFLPPVTDAAARTAVSEAVEIWQGYRSKVADLLGERDGPRLGNLPAALAEAQRSSLKLLGSMNALTTALERQTQREAQRIRGFQALALLLALACAVWAFILLRRSDLEVSKAMMVAEEATSKLRSDAAIKAFLVEVSTGLHQAGSLVEFARTFMRLVPTRLGADYGAFYALDETSRRLIPIGGYGTSANNLEALELGRGLIGQCAKDLAPIVITNSTDVGIDIEWGGGALAPQSTFFLPIVQADHLLGVIVLATLQAVGEEEQALVDALLPMAAMSFAILNSNLAAKVIVQGDQHGLGGGQIDEHGIRL